MRDQLRGVVPDWLIVGTLVLCALALAVLAGFGLQQVAFYGKPEPEQPTATVASTEPTQAPVETTPAVERTLEVSVFNNTSIAGLARRTLDQAGDLGWTEGVSGNWSGSVSENTVYYPEGGKDQAELLASDLAIDRVMPADASMSDSQLTVVLAGPQPTEPTP